MPCIVLHKCVPNQKHFDFYFSDNESKIEDFANSDSEDNSIEPDLNVGKNQPSVIVGNFYIVEYKWELISREGARMVMLP